MVYVRKTSIRQFVIDLGLKESDRYRSDCPECRGKNTFTATNELGDIKYNCFKLGCTVGGIHGTDMTCLLYTSPSPRDATLSRMPSSA